MAAVLAKLSDRHEAGGMVSVRLRAVERAWLSSAATEAGMTSKIFVKEYFRFSKS